MFTEWFNHWPFARVLAHIQYADKQIELHVMQNSEQELMKNNPDLFAK
jgi:hypothetical protein